MQHLGLNSCIVTEKIAKLSCMIRWLLHLLLKENSEVMSWNHSTVNDSPFVLQCTTRAADIFKMSGDKIQQVNASLKAMNENLSRMEGDNKSQWLNLSRRIEVLEGNSGNQEEDIGEETNPKTFTALHRECGLTGALANPEGDAHASIQSGELKWEYEALKDSVSRVKLPPHYRINDSKAGISSKDSKQVAGPGS